MEEGKKGRRRKMGGKRTEDDLREDNTRNTGKKRWKENEEERNKGK